MRKLILLLLLCNVCLCSCQSTMPKYTYTFYGSFDTITKIVAYAKNDEDFEQFSSHLESRMTQLHQLYDIYNNYDGINNLKTVNDNAGVAPVVVDKQIIDLVLLGKEWHKKTDGAVNIAFGPVLSIWHDYRTFYKEDPETAVLPPMEALQAAALFCDIDAVEVDEKQSTVFLTKKGMSLDVGALAKGYALEIVLNEVAQKSVQHYVVSAGGNVVAKGFPQDGVRTHWGIGIADPFVKNFGDNSGLLDVLQVNNMAVVTSGDYERFYQVNGKTLGHIISPFTLMPTDEFRSVTVLAQSSGIADLLSTAVYLLPKETGLALLQEQNSEAIYVFSDKHVETTQGAKAFLQNGS